MYLRYKQTLSKLKYANELLARNEQITLSGSWVWRVEKQQMHWSDQVYKIHEIDREEFNPGSQEIIKRSIDCYEPESRPKIHALFNRCLQHGDSYSLECSFTTFRGKKLWIRTTGQAIYRKGKIVCIAGNFQDITQQHEQDLALSDSELKFRTVVDQASQMLFLHDLQGVIVDVNNSAITETGYNKSELTGMNVFDIDPDAKERQDFYNIWKAAPYGKVIEFETRHKRKDGRIYPAEVTVSKIQILGKDYMLALAKNIEARQRKQALLKASEANARALMESTSNVLILIDQHGIVIDSNEAHAGRFGLSRKDIIGKHISSFLPRDLAKKRKKHIQDAISTGLTQHGEDIRDGRINEYWMVPVKNEMDVFDRVAVYAQDITDRKEAEIKLLQYTEELKELNATKDKFFSIISHDLSSPLATIKGFCDVLQDQIQNSKYDKVEKISTILAKAATHASLLLQNLTEWSRCQTNRIACKPSLICLTELIENNHQLMLESFQHKLLTFQMVIPANLKVFADKSMIDTVIRNLLSNAIKYSNKGGKIVVSANSVNGDTQLCIRDEGIGISTENFHKLFQLDESISTRGTLDEKGTGLGLVLCKEFIKYHGGKIWAESSEGKGTAIYFTLPRPSDLN